MNPLDSENTTSVRFAVVLCISSLFVAGCSGSSDPQSTAGGPNDIAASSTDNTPVDTSNDNSSGNDVANNVEDEVSSETGTIAAQSQSTTTDESSTVSEAEATTLAPDTIPMEAVVPEDVSPVFTRVEFDIVVPVYQSNALQVRLQWGATDITASFVVDESWAIEVDFPVDTENELLITFNDGNGAITLGSFEQSFRTGTNPSESFQISADQFDTNRWDNDRDGTSNLNELIADTDPAVGLTLVQDKTYRLSWQPSENAEFYRVLENPDGLSGFNPVSDDLPLSVQKFDHRVALYKRFNASYIVQSCNARGCTDSSAQLVSGTLEEAIGYFKAGNTDFARGFGTSVALNADGNTMAVAAFGFGSSGAEGFVGDSVSVFQLNNGSWSLQATLNPGANINFLSSFGRAISFSADGNLLAIGAITENAVYVFERSNGVWQQQALVQADNSDPLDQFGIAVSLSTDGTTLAVGTPGDDSAATGVNGDQNDQSAFGAGAVYIFERFNGDWQQQAFVKASNTGDQDIFGSSLSLSLDSNTLAVGARGEHSLATGINGYQSDDSRPGAGAVYIY